MCAARKEKRKGREEKKKVKDVVLFRGTTKIDIIT